MAIDHVPARPQDGTAAPGAGRPTAHRPPRPRAALAGLAATAAALGAAELVGAVLPGAASPVLVVGERVVDAVPSGLRDAALRLLGAAGKPTLVLGVLVVVALLGAGAGLLGARDRRRAAMAVAAVGLLGVLAAALDPVAAVLPTGAAVAVGVAVGILALQRLLDAAAPGGGDRAAGRGLDRRGFGRLVVAAGALAVAGGAIGRRGAQRSAVTTARAATVLPVAAAPLPAPPAGLAVDGVAPLLTPNAEFYRIDTALSVPRVDVGSWQLAVRGMVARPVALDYDALLRLPMVEVDVTLSCVSNEVGGPLVGTARWLGVPLADVLAMAGASPAATQVVGRSVDGWTGGFPIASARQDGALVAVGMNGEPLPLEHGFPARLVVPGLYGYVSATKWLAEIELTTWEAFDGYWVPRGWAKEGPIRTQSRIDVPRQRAALPPGPTAVAGVAWAPGRGLDRVEVRVDGGPWTEARVVDGLGDDAWVQWVWEWDAAPGDHRLEVRATDGTGAAQPSERRPPRPDGATGHHAVDVVVA